MASDVGSFTVDISVSDGLNTDRTNFTIVVSKKPLPQPPKITTINELIAYGGYLYSVYYKATDPDTPQNNLIWSMNTNASWLNFSSSEQLYGTPSNSDSGTYWVMIAVNDGKGKDETNFTLEVISTVTSLSPEIKTSNVLNARAGKYYSVNYTATDMDTPKKSLIWSMNTNATWLAFSSSQNLNGTPSTSDIGTFWVNISVSDGKNSDYTNFTLTVNPVPPPKPGPAPPKMTSSSTSTNSTDVPVNTSDLEIKFSEPMNTSSVEDALVITPGVNYSVSWENNNTVLKIRFEEELAHDTNYTINIGKSAKDTDGNGLEFPVQIVFTTQKSSMIDNAGDEGTDSSGWANIGIIAGIITVIAIILIILFTVLRRNHKKKGDMQEIKVVRVSDEYEPVEQEYDEDYTIDWETENEPDDLFNELTNEILDSDEPAVIDTPGEKLLNKAKTKYEKGEISRNTYDLIKERLN
jgi:uncharacterized membrane protein